MSTAKKHFMKRTHTCGELRKEDAGKTVILNGWVDNWRDHGGVRFIDLRDRYGKTQIIFDLEKNKNLHDLAKNLRREFVLAAKGEVKLRLEGMINPRLATGEIEVHASEIEVLNQSKTTPFTISDDVEANEETRMKFRYLDLRRPQMIKNMTLRHKLSQSVRNYFDSEGFIEIETPMLMKSTPEGARDYLVPSRIFPGKFFALPQSPQTYKQILMVSGMDKYIQIVKCFRDEDLRKDRQPEFTQVDVEMSFIDEEDIYNIIEGLFIKTFRDVLNVNLEPGFKKLTYDEAMNLYGTDKPDLRWDMPIIGLNDIVEKSAFKVFSGAVSSGGLVAGLTVKGQAQLSRKGIDKLTDIAKDFGAGGLVVLKLTGEGLQGGVAKFLAEDEKSLVIEKMKAEPDDLLLIVADAKNTTLEVLGNLRLKVIDYFSIPPNEKFSMLWVTEFPLVEYDEEQQRFNSTHHPFTSPRVEDIGLMDTDPAKVKSRAYDIVLNGFEVGGGSIRIHERNLQEKVFSMLNIDKETAHKKFGFLLEAFEYGAPPHGGIALGLDRIAMVFAEASSIRDVIAFPKTNRAFCPMVEAPSDVDEEQLIELGLKILHEELNNEH